MQAVKSSPQKCPRNINQGIENPRPNMLFKTTYSCCYLSVSLQSNQNCKVITIRAAVNIKFPGTEFRRGPLQLHRIQECRARTTATRSRRQNAHVPFWKLAGEVYLSRRSAFCKAQIWSKTSTQSKLHTSANN